MFGNEDETGPDGKEPSSATPYMRRSRAVTVRRGRFPWDSWRVVRGTLLAVLVLLPLAVGGYLLCVYALNSPRFQLNSSSDVAVDGNQYVSREEILNALGVPARGSELGINIFRMSLKNGEKQIDSIPWVRSARVVRSYPHHLAVFVTERTPVAFVNMGGQIKMVDQEGVLLDTPDKSHFDFPIVRGLDFRTDPSRRKPQVSLYREFMQETSDKISRSGWIVSEVNLSDPGDLQALLVQGQETLVVHFGHEQFLGRFENFLSVLPELRKGNARIDSVDLRYNNQVVVNPEGQGSGKSPTTKTGANSKAKKT
ncbi:MAG TPA: FtsQ-type POTRA domain-containing protein [Terriglobia bacterium]|nr:FtsQ-type POTRA domain-containing protein [Terriglobia bacterium]